MTSNNTPTEQQLDEIEARTQAATKGPWCTDGWEIYQGGEYHAGAEWIGETCRGPVDSWEQDTANALFAAHARTDVEVLVAEVRRLRADPPMVCINCETPVGWVDCPTGGWWAHETHPDDGHDAAPRPARHDESTVPDALPAWLYQRFAVIHGCPPWDRAADRDRAYWEHQARAVRRAVARGGFKTTRPAAAVVPAVAETSETNA